jgi:hypothetical protein
MRLPRRKNGGYNEKGRPTTIWVLSIEERAIVDAVAWLPNHRQRILSRPDFNILQIFYLPADMPALAQYYGGPTSVGLV